MIIDKKDINSVIDFLSKEHFRIFLLYGEIGVGKTTFVRNFLNNNEVTSPTFSICHQYGDIFHFDLYRIETSYEKLESVNFFYAINNFVTFVEWSEKLNLDLVNHVKEDICKIEITKDLFIINKF